MMNIILFWSTQVKDESFEEWQNKTIDLLEFHELTLASQVKYNKNVHLVTYQKFSDRINIPDEVQILDANKFYPAKNAYDDMKRGHSIAHISDLVRFRVAVQKEGVVLDLDAVAIKPLPDVDAFISTHYTKLTGGLVIKFGKTQPLFKTDGSWDGKALSVFPFKVHRSITGDINILCKQIEDSLAAKPKTGSKAWNYVMWTIRDIANKHDNVYVMKPIECCPVPGWKSGGNCYSLDSPTKFDGETPLFGNLLPSTEDIFENTYMVQHFFDSIFKKTQRLDSNLWDSIKPDSLVDTEIKHIFGTDWLQNKKTKFNSNIDDLF